MMNTLWSQQNVNKQKLYTIFLASKTYQTRYPSISIASPAIALARLGKVFGVNSSSIKSRGTMLVCIMWFSQAGKNASRAAGNTSSRFMAQRAQKMVATNWCWEKGVEQKKNTQILISLTIYLPIQPGRQGIQKDSLLQLVKISYLSYWENDYQWDHWWGKMKSKWVGVPRKC